MSGLVDFTSKLERLAEPVRLAGAPLGDRAHICAFVNNEDAYRLLLPFLKDALENGEKAVQTVDPQRREEHASQLSSAGIAVSGLGQQGQFELLDWRQTHLLDGKFDGSKTLAFFDGIVKEARRDGFSRTRFVTRMEWFLESEINALELLKYEAAANDMWMRQERPVNPIICAYDLSLFDVDVAINVLQTHPMVILGGFLQENPFFVEPAEFLKSLGEKTWLKTRRARL